LFDRQKSVIDRSGRGEGGTAAPAHFANRTVTRGTRPVARDTRLAKDGAKYRARPISTVRAAPAIRPWIWLKVQQVVAVWFTIVAVLLALKYIRKRQFQFAMEERMAISLSKAVRQMECSPESMLRRDGARYVDCIQKALNSPLR
jgi:hypothetical protein